MKRGNMTPEDRSLLKDLLTQQRVLSLSVLVEDLPYVGLLPFALLRSSGVMLPDINGFEVIRGIRANPDLDDVPVVVLTAYGDAESKRKAEQAGCDGFLRKPVSVHMIRDAIDEFAPEPAK